MPAAGEHCRTDLPEAPHHVAQAVANREDVVRQHHIVGVVTNLLQPGPDIEIHLEAAGISYVFGQLHLCVRATMVAPTTT